MKVTIDGKTPLERLTNFTKKIIAVQKHEIESEDAKWKKRKKPRARR